MIKEEQIEKIYCDTCKSELKGMDQQFITISHCYLKRTYEFEMCNTCFNKLVKALDTLLFPITSELGKRHIEEQSQKLPLLKEELRNIKEE